MTVTKYKIVDVERVFTFNTNAAAEQFKAENPFYANAVIISFDEEVIEPARYVPQSVPLWCLRTVLRAMGLLQTVVTTIAAMPDGVQKIAAEEGIEYANTVLRNSPTTLFIQSVLQLTDEQVDDIFINANAVEA